VNFESFLVSYFAILELSIFFLSFLGFKFFCVKFHKGKDICFFSRNLEGLLLWYFETPKFSISFLSFWGSSIFLCEVFTSKETRYVPFFM
jgi:hypothetical protein